MLFSDLLKVNEEVVCAWVENRFTNIYEPEAQWNFVNSVLLILFKKLNNVQEFKCSSWVEFNR